MANEIAELRLLCPRRQMPAWEARILAERQAHRLQQLIRATDPPFPEQAIEHLPRVEVRYVRSRRLAGAVSWTGRRWRILVNSDDPWGRQRFSMSHELKHLIDHPFKDTIYRDGRFGSADLQAERAADYFAACLLMPRIWLKRAFYDQAIRDPRMLARHFQVSTTAMRYRLDQLGILEPAGRRA